MSGFKSAWNTLTWAAGIYAVYNHLRNLNKAKDELFEELSPDQQALWIKVFGNPHSTVPTVNQLLVNPVKLPPPAPGGTLEQIKAGT